MIHTLQTRLPWHDLCDLPDLHMFDWRDTYDLRDLDDICLEGYA